MMIRTLTVACAAILCVGISRQARSDEVDDLVKRLRPPARFAGYVPDFSVEEREYTLEYLDGPRKRSFFIVKDRDRYVALIPISGGTIHLLDFNPRTASKTFAMPAERWRIETSIGTKLRTDAFIPTKEGQRRETYEFTKARGSLTLVRRYQGTSTFDKWTYRSKGPVTVDTTNTFALRCDPVFGYVVEGTFDSGVKPAPESFEYFSAATAGICDVWAGEDACSRVAITPTYKEGFEGYYLNFPAIDWCDDDRAKFRCRDGGFATFLNRTTGWSPTTTLEGCEARFVVCNAHADLDFVTQWPGGPGPGLGSLTRRVVKTRVLALPPEITRHVWDNMSLRFEAIRRVQMRVGTTEDFEDQPLPLTTWVRGLTSTGGGPKVTEQHARSGRKSVVIEGRFWPNLPQVALKPDTRYRLQAWMKVLPWTAEQRRAAEEKERARIERQRKSGGQVADFGGFGPAEAYITGHLYQSSPHQNVWIVQQRTNSARPGGSAWQKVSLEFTAPKWGPFINLVFVANACTAYMDDFCLEPIGEGKD